MKKPMNPQKVKMRSQLLETFMVRKISLSIQNKIARVFANTPENKKESLAAKIIEAIENGATEEKLLQTAKEFK